MAGLLAATGVSAQQTIDEIVITAEKRQSTVLETALAISAFDQSALDRNGISRVEDLEMAVPNFKFGDLNLGFGGAQITIRGISNDNVTNDGDPSIAVHLDGVYLPRISSGNALFYDIERVEVLRGPQGTLYGRNTTSGTVNVISRRPEFESTFDAEITAGSDSLLGVQGALNGAIVADRLAGRLAFTYRERDGLRSNGPAPDGDDLDYYGLRGSLLFQASENVSLLLGADYFEQSGAGTVMAAIPFDRPEDPTPFEFPFVTDPQSFGLNTQPETDNNDWGVRAELNWDAGDTRFTYLGALRSNQRKNVVDRDGTEQIPTVADLCRFNPPPVPCAVTVGPSTGNLAITDQVADSFSHEVRLASQYDDSRWEWLLGLYYFEEEQDTDFDAVLEGLRGTGFIAPFLGSAPPALAADPATRINRINDQLAESIAAFAQASYRFGAEEQFRITAGLRWTKDEKDDGKGAYTGFTLEPLTAPRAFTQADLQFPIPGSDPICTDGSVTVFRCLIRDRKDDWSEVNWKLGFDWHFSEDWMLFVSGTEGYRSGGFNDGNTYDPETNLAIEAGLKGQFLGGRAQADIALFHYTFDDQQVSQVQNAAVITSNAGESTLFGAEFAGSMLLGETGRLDLTVAYLDTEYDKFDGVDDPQTPGIVLEDLSGNELLKSPEWSVNIGLEPVAWQFAGNASLTPRINFHYESDFFLLAFNNPQNQQDSYTRTDFRLIYDSGETWSLEAWVKNIEDDDVLVGQFTTPNNLLTPPQVVGLPPGAGRQELLLGSYAPPRTLGVTFRLSS
ncbi:MAG: TonB-dependent receptor [Woeseiaceae bacterium]|nr:TonB-dependent receptor [Woeseiaceae bacterium]